jgi:hypothetical protein
MDDRDKRIYNSLGDTSGPKGKMTFSELDLNRQWQKRGIMFKSGPVPSWYSRWKKRVFVLKGNFLYYLPAGKKLRDAPVLGAIYLKHAIVEKTSLPFAKLVLSITPPVPRRKGWRSDETSIFYIRFRTAAGRDEWFEELQQVSFDHKFPALQDASVSNSLKIKHEIPTKHKDRRSWREPLL